MEKEWVPPGENVGNVSICYFWLARRCRCLHNKNILPRSARLLEKSWHSLEHWIHSVAETLKEGKIVKAIAETQPQGRRPSYTSWGPWAALGAFSPTPVGRSLFPTLSKPILHSSPRCSVSWKLTFRESINLCPISVVSSWIQPREDTTRWSEGGRIETQDLPLCQYRLGGIMSLNLNLSSLMYLSHARLWWTSPSRVPSGLQLLLPVTGLGHFTFLYCFPLILPTHLYKVRVVNILALVIVSSLILLSSDTVLCICFEFSIIGFYHNAITGMPKVTGCPHYTSSDRLDWGEVRRIRRWGLCFQGLAPPSYSPGV